MYRCKIDKKCEGFFLLRYFVTFYLAVNRNSNFFDSLFDYDLSDCMYSRYFMLFTQVFLSVYAGTTSIIFIFVISNQSTSYFYIVVMYRL